MVVKEESCPQHLSIGKGLQAPAVEERGEEANRETLAHGWEEVRLGSPGRRPAVLQRHWRGSQES